MKVYAVERGQYSDYGIVATFSTKTAAEHAIKTMTFKYGDERVVAWTVWDEVPPPVTWYVKEFFRGKVTSDNLVLDGWDAGPPYRGRVTRGLGFGKWDGNYRFWGTDEARVHKAFDDYHAQRQAEKAGIA